MPARAKRPLLVSSSGVTWRRLDAFLAVLAGLFAVYAFATGQLFYGVAAGVLAGVFTIQARGGTVFRILGRGRTPPEGDKAVDD